MRVEYEVTAAGALLQVQRVYASIPPEHARGRRQALAAFLEEPRRRGEGTRS